MAKNKDLEHEKLAATIEERGRRVLERSRKATISGLTQPKFISIMDDVNAYWQDKFRPALTSFCCEAVGGKAKAAEDASLMITLASVGCGIHDDIIDKTPNKHFRMTLPGLHGVDNALLVGDLLIVKAWTVIGEMLKTLPSQQIAKVVDAYGSFFLEVCEGEFMETLCRQNLDSELDDYKEILWKSTADTEACARLGAVLGGGLQSEVDTLSEFGRRLGFMFRLIDDVRDSLNLEGNLPHRLKHESVPLPLLYAAKSSKEKYRQIKSIIKKSRITAQDVRLLLKTCFDTEAFAYVNNLAKKNAEEAERKLDTLSHKSVATDMLRVMLGKASADIADLCFN